MHFFSALALCLVMSLVVFTMSNNADITIFYNLPALLLVLIGTILLVVVKFGLLNILKAFIHALGSFTTKKNLYKNLCKECVELANISRKNGMLKIEELPVSNKLLRKGIKCLIDGGKIEQALQVVELENTAENLSTGKSYKIFSSMAELAPYMGMIGTLIGLVKLLASLENPEYIGPSMAIALLTTLYGALFANLIAYPFAVRIKEKISSEKKEVHIVKTTLQAINEGINPKALEGILNNYNGI